MKRLLYLAVVAIAIACNSTPRTPAAPDVLSPPITALSPFSGVWTGDYRITSTTGAGHRPGTVRPFTLRLEQTRALLRGNFQTDSVLIDVTGTMDGSGFISLEGSAPGLGRGDFVGAATLVRFRARVDPASGLAGDFEYRLDRTAETRLGFTTVYTGDIATAQRTKLPPPTFDGTWSGSFVVRECSKSCLPPHVSETGAFRLELRDNGGSVAGLIWVRSFTQPGLPVSGHVEGDRLVLESAVGDGAFRILEWATERDRFGRMSGSFVYEERGIRRDVQLGTVSLMP
jgi:hypothetical protein